MKIIQDHAIGKIIFSTQALQKMKNQGIQLFQIIDTFQFGEDKPYQDHWKQFTHQTIQVIASDIDPQGTVLVSTCGKL